MTSGCLAYSRPKVNVYWFKLNFNNTKLFKKAGLSHVKKAWIKIMRKTKSEPISLHDCVLIMPYSFILFYYLQSTFIYTISFNPHKNTVKKSGIIPVLRSGNLSSTKRVVDVGFKSGLPLFRACNLPHCAGLEGLTKGSGGLLATMWQLSDLILDSVYKVSITSASLCPPEE